MPFPRFIPPAECPICGTAVSPKAKACPECGADENTGWNEERTAYDGINLPDSAFEEESLLTQRHGKRRTREVIITIAGIILLAALLLRLL